MERVKGEARARQHSCALGNLALKLVRTRQCHEEKVEWAFKANEAKCCSGFAFEAKPTAAKRQ